MKLIRLTSNNNQGIFDNTIQSDIILSPYSKVALANACFEIQQDTIIIDSENDRINFQVSTTAGQQFILLNHNTYDKYNYPQLLNEITQKLNSKMLNQGKQIGIEWLAKLTTSNKVVIEYRQGPLRQFELNLTLNDVNFNSSGIYNANTGVTNVTDNTRNLYLNKFVSRGCGGIRCRTHTSIDNQGVLLSNGYIIGLSKTNPDTLTTFEDLNINFGIHATKPNTPYSYIIDGTFVATATNVNYIGANNANNDNLEVFIVGDKIQFRVYQQGSPPEGILLHEENYNYGDKLYPFIIFRGNSTVTKIKNLRISESQFNTNPYSLNQEQEVYELGTNPPTQSTRKTTNYLEFEGVSLASYLGFQNTYNGPFVIQNAKYEGDDIFTIPENNELSIIELLNIKLMSYDGLSQERRSILCTIPKKDVDTIIQYEPNEKIWIDINNSEPLLLRNIQAVIRRNDLSFQETKGLSSLTILFKDKDE